MNVERALIEKNDALETADQLKVESRLTTADKDQLKIGMEMELVFETFRHDEDGNEVISFAFKAV